MSALKLSLFVLIVMGLFEAGACPRVVNPAFQRSQVQPPYREFLTSSRVKPKIGKMSEALFDEVMDKIEEIYQPYLALAGIKFSVQRNYASNYQNAHPGRDGDHWFIEMYGGYFRNRSYETYEAVMNVACHEMGHHLGETNYYGGSWSWASGEGQSDYYATLKCLRMVYETEDNQKWVDNYPEKIPLLVMDQCAQAWGTQKEINLCVRSSMTAYQSVSSRGAEVAFDTPDPYVAPQSYIYHPDSQCRLDSEFQGALCGVNHNIGLEKSDHSIGACNAITGDTIGLRPACWYKEPLSVE